jgi:hypothetical protein
MTDRIHTRVQTVEHSPRQPSRDHLAPEAQPTQLPSRHHSVLTFRQFGDQTIRRTNLLSCVLCKYKSRFVGHTSTVPA